MSYLTNSEVQTRLGAAPYVQLTDDAGTGSADEAVVDEAREGAEGEVNSHLAQRYAVPIDLTVHSEVAGLLKSIALDLTEHRLYARRREVPKDVAAKRESALDWLRRVGRGEAALPSVAPIGPGEPFGARAVVTGGDRVLSPEELEEF